MGELSIKYQHTQGEKLCVSLSNGLIKQIVRPPGEIPRSPKKEQESYLTYGEVNWCLRFTLKCSQNKMNG